MLSLSLPVLLSLVAEPLTGVADTAFIARLGPAPTAALGVATALLSSVFWVFNFLGIGTQTAVARAHGTSEAAERSAAESVATALAVSLVAGALLAALAWPFLDALVVFMGADDAVRADAVTYLRIRLLAAPALLWLAPVSVAAIYLLYVTTLVPTALFLPIQISVLVLLAIFLTATRAGRPPTDRPQTP